MAYDMLLNREAEDRQHTEAVSQPRPDGPVSNDGVCTMAESPEPCSDPRCPIHG